jgi:hypothetical protein
MPPHRGHVSSVPLCLLSLFRSRPVANFLCGPHSCYVLYRYVIINTAISSTWGFPTPCPYGCACDCFDCRNPDCACAVPHDMCQNLPAHFLIDYVRVYQVEK